ncbi:AraC family transcriptional regulator [Olivibacter sp. SDN3]|uniref:helix-turn-helix domain-containing protein n=1 Tax=Olivibacter sp. SDN3 TaxID=2764720 RepID=UPI0016514260|nr:AraC family transcriptional regulator [Olivibacter sp. SDN3]QNL48154.1 AraC family transcriptional regulator [Olivibacter sp. SDN3]
MIAKQHIHDYSKLPDESLRSPQGGGYFAAIKLDDFSSEQLAATSIYSRKDFYKISLIKGDATYHYQDRSYQVKPGDCVLVFTNSEIPYRWHIHSGKCSGYSCMFTEDFLPLHTYIRPADWDLFGGISQSVFLLNPEQEQEFTDIFKKMMDEQDITYKHKYELLFVYVLEIIYRAMKMESIAKTNRLSAKNRLTQTFKSLLNDQFPVINPFQPLTLRTPQHFADHLAVHINYLNRALKENTGKTTTNLISERIHQEARALLIHSNWTINQISHCLGFEEATNFTKAFRKYAGVSPSELRKKV